MISSIQSFDRRRRHCLLCFETTTRCCSRVLVVVIMQKFECNFECCGVRKKANEGEQIKKKRKQKGQVPLASFFLQETRILKGKKVSLERICSLFALKKSCTRNAILIKVALFV